jgi:hypothetical protein
MGVAGQHKFSRIRSTATASETLVSNHHTTLRNKPGNNDLYIHRREDLKSYTRNRNKFS